MIAQGEHLPNKDLDGRIVLIAPKNNCMQFGLWRENKRHGASTTVWLNGKITTGSFSDGKQHG